MNGKGDDISFFFFFLILHSILLILNELCIEVDLGE